MATSKPILNSDKKSWPQTLTPSGAKRKPERTSAKRRIIQNFLLIWLDANIDESKEDFRESITQLRAVVNSIDMFTDADRCINYMNGIKEERIFLIVSGAFGQQVVPRTHQMPQLECIFVFCGNKSWHEQWVKAWSKVRGVFTKIKHVCEALKQAAKQCDHDSVTISCIPISSNESNLPDLSFMYTQLLKEVILDIKFDEQALRELGNFCRVLYDGNPKEMKDISKLEQEYLANKPIWWYTYECFLYKTLNRALRNLEVDILLKMGFFIRDLHRHISELHVQQYAGASMKQSFIVYRGQQLSKPDFEELTRTSGGLMSFNNFLSTSRNEHMSLQFVLPATEKDGMVGVLFQIQVDPSISSSPFASVDKFSAIPSEDEVLFSMHTVFRIGEIKQRGQSNRLYQVKLTLVTSNDQQLSALTHQLREEIFPGLYGAYRLGPLLWKLGEYEQAESIYKVFLEQKPDDLTRAYLYNMLGAIKLEQDDCQEAIQFVEKSLEIRKRHFPRNHPELAQSYNNISVAYKGMREYAKALLSLEKALEIEKNCSPIHHHTLGLNYMNIGLVYGNLNDFAKALAAFEKTLETWRNSLSTNHPDVARCYSNMGESYLRTNEFTKALSFAKKSFDIRKSILPPTHPDLAGSYYELGAVYDVIGNFTEACSFHQKSLEIRKKVLPSQHMALGHSYNALGCVYVKMGNDSKAIPLLEKATEILEKHVLEDDVSLGESYNNVGTAYQRTNEYAKALALYEKAIGIFQKVLVQNHPEMANNYNNIGFLCYEMGNYDKALSLYEKALEIRKNMKPPNKANLAQSYNNMGLLYETRSEYSEALPFYEKVLKIFQETVPTNCSELRQAYEIIGRVYDNMGEYRKAISCWEHAIDIARKSLPPTHPQVLAIKKSIEHTKTKL